MGLAFALVGCALFVAGLVLAVLWLIPSFRSQHPRLGRSAIGGLVLGFVLFLTGGMILSKSRTSESASQSNHASSPSPVRVPPD